MSKSNQTQQEGNSTQKLIPHFSKDYWSQKRQMERQAKRIRKDFKRFLHNQQPKTN